MSKVARPACMWLLVLSMTLGLLPTGAVQALAEEIIVLDAQEEQAEPELYEPELVPSEEGEGVQPEEGEESSEPDDGADGEGVVEVVPADDDAPATAETSSDDAAVVEDEAEENNAEDEAEDEADQPTTFKYEDDRLVVTAEAASGVLPEGTTLQVSEVRPVDQESADAYGEALSALSDALRAEDRSYTTATVYDIKLLDADGIEFEPGAEVKINMSYKQALSLGDVEQVPVEDAEGKTAPAADVAHLTAEGDLQMMGAELTTNGDGDLKEATFTTDSFSYYITFGSNQGSTSEPINVGNYGWLKFATPSENPYPDDPNGQWGHYSASASLPTIYPGKDKPEDVSEAAWDEQYHRILQVRLHTLNNGANETSYDDTNYTLVANNEYFWTWENNIYISDFYVPGYEVVQTKMHTAWDPEGTFTQADSLVGNYAVRGYRSSDGTADNELGVDHDINVLDVYMKSVPTPQNAMRYIIRYVHADGSVTDGNVRYLESGSTGAIDVNHPRAGEVFSGIAVAAGDAAVSANTSAKTVTFTYDENVNLAKAYVYFEKDPNNTTTQDKGRYDKQNGEYYNGALGLYTDKSAEPVEGKDREFLVNLETWYIDEAASVGMVLDASGSMTWTAGVPTVLDLDAVLAKLDSTTRNRILGRNSMSMPISANDLNLILDRTAVDNSSLGYNDYEYYVYTATATAANPISEYAPLGYSDGRRDTSKTSTQSGGALILGNNNTVEGYADASNNYAGAGWYYVNPSTTVGPFNAYGSKRFEGIPSSHMTDLGLEGQNSAARFWVETENGKHVLKCLFNCGNTNSVTATYPYNDNSNVEMRAPGTQVSTVYAKRDQMMTKSETLQDSIAQFGAILNGVSPKSEVAITRFSHRSFNDLQLLGWTNESEKMASAMDLVPGLTGNAARDDGTYQYAITGGTVTYRGLKEFQDSYKATADAKPNSKYIIIFTDGKDQGLNHEDNGQVTCDDISYQSRIYRSGSWRNYNGGQINLDSDEWKDYTVITMFMRSVGMSDSDVAASRTFLRNLASGGKDGDPNKKLFFEAGSDSSHDVVEQFRDIAEHIVTGLHGVSVRDYIDPRFDVVNDAGQVLTVLDENGEFTNATNPDVNAAGMRGFTTPDGKQAQLGYDRERGMFYVLWQDQDIQASPRNGSSVTTWKSQIRLTAKEDFLGGNDILTNGNLPGENLVYEPLTHYETDPNDPSSQILVPNYDEYGREIIDESKVHKSFPHVSVNPGLLDVALGNYEDTIFLGEEIKPGELLSVIAKDAAAKERTDTAHRVADTVYNAETMNALGDTDQSSIWYVEYLERLGKKLHNNKDYYGTILEHLTLTGNTGVDRLVTELENTSLYTFSTNNGVVTATGKANTKAAGEKIIIDKNSAKITLELPYYYLESPTDTSTYAGRDRANAVDPQDDKVGTITYTWECKDFAGNVPVRDTKNEGNKFVPFDTYVSKTQHMDTTKAVQYQLGISYMPDPVLDAATGDDGSARTKALTGQTSVAQPLIRNAVGTEWTEAKSTGADQGWAVIHAVDGRILVEKRMLTADLEQMRADAPDASITLTLTGNNITSAPANEVVWTKTLAVSAATDLRVEGDYTYIVSEWATGLPQGAYTLTETVTDKFGTPVIEGVDDVAFWTLDNSDNDPAKPYADAPSTWRAAYSGSVTWNIGTANSTTCSYTDTDYSYGMVEGDLAQATHKNVDPLLSANAGKAYLNAQLGRARVTNAPAKTSITVTKVWEGATPNAPIVIQLTGSDGTTRYAELNAGNSWSHTFTGLPINNTTYTAVEGIGTVTDETHASFSALETGAAGFDLDDKHYKQASVVYKDKDGATIAANQITGNVAPLAGSVTFTNQALTKVKVTKVWEGITPAQPIVIKLTSSGEADRFVQLGTDSWEYTWEDLPVAANRTYAIVEGTGTVASNGTCPDFRAFDTSADNFTFDNKTYRQKSLTYTPAGGQAGTSPLACVSPDSGAAEVINEALTKVEVKKEWAEGSTKSPMVIELKDSDNNKTYVELNESNGYAHAFENLKVKEGLTYTVTEGTGTVNASDSTCADFSAIEGVYTVNGEKMKRLSIEYYSDADATTKATPQSLNGAISPYGGKAVVTNGPVQAKVTLKKVESTDHDKTIAGVTFNLLTGDDFATATAVAASPVTTGDDGTVDLGALKPGTYWLVEASAPDGYVLRDADDPIKLVVDDEGNATLSESIKPNSQYPAPELTQNENGEYELMVPNMRLYALPAAGGPGAYPFLLIGAFVAALSMSETFGGKRRRATAFGRHSQHGGKGWW